jgi:hypothetical protein
MGPPGTGGTGFMAQGTISGFGSVIVNGIRFDDSAATVQLDGQIASSSDLRLGMVASVQGERGADLTLGTASRIDIWSVAQGIVTQVLLNEFTLAGMVWQIDSATVFDGINSAALETGRRVAVWGLQSGVNGQRWTATRIAAVTANDVVSTGVVSLQGSLPYLNGMLLSGTGVDQLNGGEILRVQGTLNTVADTLLVASFSMQGSSQGFLNLDTLEIEGLVTSLLPNDHFMLGAIKVDASKASYSPLFAQISLGARVEVEGTWQSDVLQAVRCEIGDEDQLRRVEISARIEEFTSLANFVVRGQRCDASGVTAIANGSAADLKIGVKIKLTGLKSDDVVLVSTLVLLV